MASVTPFATNMVSVYFFIRLIPGLFSDSTLCRKIVERCFRLPQTINTPTKLSFSESTPCWEKYITVTDISAVRSQVNGNSTLSSEVCPHQYYRNYQRSVAFPFVRGVAFREGKPPVISGSPHKELVMHKMFPSHNGLKISWYLIRGWDLWEGVCLYVRNIKYYKQMSVLKNTWLWAYIYSFRAYFIFYQFIFVINVCR